MTGHILVTGGTGYLGSYAVLELIRGAGRQVTLLSRFKDRKDAETKLWNAFQLHVDEAEFIRLLPSIDFVRGDLTSDRLGLSDIDRARVQKHCTSVLHIAASLNRKSEKACLNANLRGTLSVINLARSLRSLERFTHVSTVAVAGQRSSEVVQEATAIDWNRSDYDPYGRTKKFCEHMVRELLPETSKVFLRPSIVMGDSRFPKTTQFDMVRAFAFLSDCPLLPFSGDTRLDIVNADFVGPAIAKLHVKPQLAHDIYHLSSGEQSSTASQIAKAMIQKDPARRPPRFIKQLETPFSTLVDGVARLPKGQASLIGNLLKVFLPYITYNTVFDNRRVTTELGQHPIPFTQYASGLYQWSKSVGYKYPTRPFATPHSTKEGASTWVS